MRLEDGIFGFLCDMLRFSELVFKPAFFMPVKIK